MCILVQICTCFCFISAFRICFLVFGVFIAQFDLVFSLQTLIHSLLLKHASLYQRGNTALISAMAHGDIDCMRILVQDGGDELNYANDVRVIFC